MSNDRYDQERRDEHARRQELDRKNAATGQADCVRITVNGKLAEHYRTLYYENQAWELKQAWLFFNNLKSALLMPRLFTFNSDCGMEAAKNWIAHHERRLNIKFSGLIELRDTANHVVDSFTALGVE